MRLLLASMAVAALAGCASSGVAPEDFVYDPELIDGTAFFGESREAAPPVDVLGLSPAMNEFLTPTITGPILGYTRFRRLMEALVDGGYFSNHYQANGTFIAAETFATRRGNCLGYTNMFIALARASGLRATYQLVDSDPVWDVNGGYLVRNNHVNVVVQKVSFPGVHQSHLTVDFNLVRPDMRFARAKFISDEYAEALFYANIGVDHMQAGDPDTAFAYYKRAIQSDATNPVAWNNLAVLYSRYGRPKLAQRTYETALALNPRDKAALSGMVVVLEAQKKWDEAEGYAKRVRRYQERNPYYHYVMAEEAFANEDYPTALLSLETAIGMRANDARFFDLRARTAAKLGDEALKRKSERLAAKYGDQKVASPEEVLLY